MLIIARRQCCSNLTNVHALAEHIVVEYLYGLSFLMRVWRKKLDTWFPLCSVFAAVIKKTDACVDSRFSGISTRGEDVVCQAMVMGNLTSAGPPT